VQEQLLGAVADVAAISVLCNDACILGHNGDKDEVDDDHDSSEDGHTCDHHDEPVDE